MILATDAWPETTVCKPRASGDDPADALAGGDAGQ